ncbi:protein of unknown function DUF839 [Gloeothece citriformis PCC 7424]|uniref:Phosphatase n=1 Tax=Gloeothece citriformis (strain PCC 7424) TaxID=65393 RepID=B7KCN0_GLOC7|nr:alkaline phosphatase PhoX [Gloeothece citriformis]ACK71581.1 protein of unknown function DUF839 [Gloeothece citriformis PCC 7424]
MSYLSRRQILYFLGGAAGAAVLDNLGVLGSSDAAQAQSTPLSFTPFRMPRPLSIYEQQPSWYATGLGKGITLPAGYRGNNPPTDANGNLLQYTVIDDVIVPPEFERYIIIQWGDRVFPNPSDYFGYNNDYTGFVPLNADSSDGLLWVNHEYVSYPISFLAPGSPSDLAGLPTSFASVIGFNLPSASSVSALSPADRRLLFGEFLYNLGGSVVRIRMSTSRRSPTGRYVVVRDPLNRRITGLSGLAINSQRTDGYQSVTSWGSLPHQQGNNDFLVGTGPAATEVFNLSVDGLGNQIIGTAYNCSGGTTPWGTILSGEENFQGSSSFFIGVTEQVNPNGTQLIDPSNTRLDAQGYTIGTSGQEFGLVGEKYGWMVEIDPADPGVRRKHTWLGRFRHENFAIRADVGGKVVVYSGDDRRGGHTYKYVSNGTVNNPADKANSNLFTDGILYVAKFNPDGTGTWIPLLLNTPTNPTPPSVLASVQLAQQGAISSNANTYFPRRAGIAGQTVNGGWFIMTPSNEATSLPGYQGKTLADFYPTQGAILCDAYAASNLVGGTPGGRPEDIEIHPITREVFVSYTDNRPSSDGYPDSRIFVVAKYNSNANAPQHFGGLYKIVEQSADGSGTSFTWEIFKQGGEEGTTGGAGINAPAGSGFGFSDNLVFDSQGNLFGVIDMSTDRHNGFDVGASATPFNIDHSVVGNAENLIGCFGNNWMYVIPASGPAAGEVISFAQGPMRCELTGPTFVGNTLLIAVQHPGEDCPIGNSPILNRDIQILDTSGTTFVQNRSVPRGSSWPTNLLGNSNGIPRPAVIGIRRKDGGQFI